MPFYFLDSEKLDFIKAIINCNENDENDKIEKITVIQEINTTLERLLIQTKILNKLDDEIDATRAIIQEEKNPDEKIRLEEYLGNLESLKN